MNKNYRYFLMVARVGSIKKAAEHLHVTQPTLTTAIKKLEEEVGVPLLHRRSKGVELTDYGRLFQKYVEEQQEKHVDLLHRLQDMQQREMGKLKLGVGEAWWELFVRDAIGEYQAQYPESSLYIEFGNNLSLMQHLVQGDIDLFVGHEINGLQDRLQVQFRPLLQDLENLYVGEHHPLLSETSEDADLAEYPLLKVTPGHARYSSLVTDSFYLEAKGATSGDTSRVMYELDSLQAGIDMLKLTNAIMPYTDKMEGWMRERGICKLMTNELQVGNIGIYHKPALESEKVNFLIERMLGSLQKV